jgi:hypothetical protein
MPTGLVHQELVQQQSATPQMLVKVPVPLMGLLPLLMPVLVCPRCRPSTHYQRYQYALLLQRLDRIHSANR